MAEFYGSVQGNRGSIHRLGSKKSGISTTAASWRGKIEVYVYQNKEGEDCFRVWVGPWQQGGPEQQVIAEGKFANFEQDC